MTEVSPAAGFDLTGVSLTRDGKALLRDVTVSVTQRRIGVVGRNGSGKTTFARVLAGLIAVDAGQVRVCGVDVATDRKAALGVVGILFQNPDHQIIFPTVEEELGFGLSQMGFDKAAVAAQVAAILTAFDKAHWAKAATHQLSQGQKQLVCLMAIMAMRPAVIVLDEPFSGLDLPTRAQLARHLGRVDATLVHISHDPDVLRDYDRVIWIDGGCVQQDGPAGAVLDAFTVAMTELGARDDISDLAS